MTNITQINGANVPVVPSGSAQQQLGQSDFLRLMTTQMNAQDPFNPMDNSAMVAQMAEFSSVAGISEMNASLRAITAQIAEQNALLADLAGRLNTPEPPTP
jgi:flagellar basal-body rod modification protein FlgD